MAKLDALHSAGHVGARVVDHYLSLTWEEKPLVCLEKRRLELAMAVCSTLAELKGIISVENTSNPTYMYHVYCCSS
jgi:hypothetical protein